MGEIHRSAVTGQFVSAEEAEANPRETITAKLPGGTKGWCIKTKEGKLDIRFAGDSRHEIESFLVEGETLARIRVEEIGHDD